jgi:hypothetical protein
MIYEAIVNGQVLWRVYWKRELAATFLSQEEAKEYLMLLEFVEQLPNFKPINYTQTNIIQNTKPKIYP